MKFSWLSRDKDGDAIQAFPLRKNFINLENPTTITSPRIIVCVEDGTITITWNDGSTDDVDFFIGDSYTIDGALSLLIVSGKFHVIGKTVA